MDAITTNNSLPTMLNAYQVSELLGISLASTYTLFKSKDFPTLTIGRRMVVPQDKFLQWVENNSERHMEK